MKRNYFNTLLLAASMLMASSVWAHDGDHTYTNGICTIDGCTDKYQAPALVDGWYQLTNAGNVEWIGDYVENVAINPNVKMMNDIDFTGVSFRMIGRNSGRKFNGVFDGQGHRITNLVLNYGSADTPTAIGFFAWVRGGSTIKNVIMDKTCYFEGKVRVAAFVGVTQLKDAGAVRIENCVNEANVKGHTGATGGFIGCRNPDNQDTPQAIISGCVNLGDITCTDKNEAAAFVGWANSASDKHIVENCYNLGNITSDGDKRGFIRGDNLQITNSYDFGSNKANNNQNVSYSWTTADPVASGELAYRLNQVAEALVLYQTLGTGADDAYPVPFSTNGRVYAHGNYRCDGVALPGTTYNNVASDAPNIPPHNYSNGICQNEGCTKPYQEPATDGDGWMLLANAGNVEWFSNLVATSNGSHVAKVKLTADIDFENVENLHSPIGPSTGSKFKGEFDGQGHRIMNMIINRPSAADGQGFFGWLQGNSPVYIHDLIIDSSCSITANNKVGALAGASQNEGSQITIENVVTGATVTGSGQDVAAIVGGESGNKATYYVHNVVNTGTITSTHNNPYAGALFCFQEKGIVKNFLNLGTIVGHNGGNMGRFSGNWVNVVDLSDTDMTGTNEGETNRGIIAELTKADIASGKLAYYMNTVAEETAFYQTIGTDAYPVPFSTHLQVYSHGDFRCDGEALGPVTYDNEDPGEVIPPHSFDANGFCQNEGCTKPNQAPELVSEWYELTNAGNVEWFSDKVNGGELAIKGKMMNDIDFTGVTHTPIGNSTGKKFNGTFDGQGFRIKNMIINRDSENGVGFFGYLRGAGTTTIQNLIIDASCSIHGNNRVGAITGSVQVGGGTITVENVINEANVSANGQDAGGIFGGCDGGNPAVIIKNVLNKGNVTSTHTDAHVGALCCFLEGNGASRIENFVNLGTIGTHKGGNIGRHNIGNSNVTNLIDLSDTEDKTQGIDSGLTTDDIANGKLAYTVGWGQLLGTDGYPTPFNETEVLYVGDAGYSTFYDASNDWKLNGDASPYIGLIFPEEKYVKLAEVDDIPSGTAVIIKGTYYNKISTPSTTSDVSSNQLLGSDGSVPGGSDIYVLGLDDEEGVGFYRLNSSLYVPNGKAYFSYPGGGDIKGFSFFYDDDTTTIRNLDAQSPTDDAAPVFNLSGQRLMKTQKGINIVGGKKVMF